MASGASAPLGIKTKYSSNPLDSGLLNLVDRRTGEIHASRTPAFSRAERFSLLAVAADILGHAHRTSKCMCRTVPKEAVKILKDTQTGKAFFAGVRACGSVWTCPHCAAKISERRRIELTSALSSAKLFGYDVKLLTLTIPHGIGDDVNDIVRRLLSAWKRMSSGRAAQVFRRSIGLVGTIRAFEVTYGVNGFHPHLHVLLFLDRFLPNSSLHDDFSSLWQNACRLAGLPIPSRIHGCCVDDGSHAAAYASKWGLESEMTKGHIKRGKAGGMTPFDFLRAVHLCDADAARYKALFRLYAAAFKGKRQLHWSVGLRDLLALGKDQSDEELAAAQTESASLLAELSVFEFRSVVHARAHAYVLDVAERDPALLKTFIRPLVDRYREYISMRQALGILPFAAS